DPARTCLRDRRRGRGRSRPRADAIAQPDGRFRNPSRAGLQQHAARHHLPQPGPATRVLRQARLHLPCRWRAARHGLSRVPGPARPEPPSILPRRPHEIAAAGSGQARRPPERYMPVIMPRFSHRLALKILLPFAALTLAVGAVGTMTATGELNARSQEAFDSQLVHDGFVTQSMVVAGDSERRAILKLLTAGPGRSQNWAKPAMLTAWLERALTIHPNVIVEAVDTSGHEIVGVVGHGALADTVTQNHDLSSWPGVTNMLSGG